MIADLKPYAAYKDSGQTGWAVHDRGVRKALASYTDFLSSKTLSRELDTPREQS